MQFIKEIVQQAQKVLLKANIKETLINYVNIHKNQFCMIM